MKTYPVKFTTIALETEQFLKMTKSFGTNAEIYCIGFSNEKREPTLDGFYFRKELLVK